MAGLPGRGCRHTEAEAVDDIATAFAGHYGPLWGATSLAAVVQDRIVAVVMTVRRPVWPDTPDGPFVIELFTDPTQRRAGLAAGLLHDVLTVAAAAGETTVGLRVRTDNTAARSLCRSLGFLDQSR